MTNVALAALATQLGAGESWWTHNGGSVVVAVAAVLAAGVAAFVALRNHKAQLAHDRRLRSEDRVQEAVDVAVICANELEAALDRLTANVETIEEWRLKGEELPESASSSASKERTDSMALMQQMWGHYLRIRMRLEEHHPVARSYLVLLEKCTNQFGGVQQGISQDRGQDEREADKDRVLAVNDASMHLNAACFEWFNEMHRQKRKRRFHLKRG